jgi:hypothetical protein
MEGMGGDVLREAHWDAFVGFLQSAHFEFDGLSASSLNTFIVISGFRSSADLLLDISVPSTSRFRTPSLCTLLAKEVDRGESPKPNPAISNTRFSMTVSCVLSSASYPHSLILLDGDRPTLGVVAGGVTRPDLS